ncbi:MAG: hypothetical protein ACREUX_18780 [Burkholderiales bacterium]
MTLRASGPGSVALRLRAAPLAILVVWAHAVSQPYNFRLPYLGEPARGTVVRSDDPCDDCGRILSVREVAAPHGSASPRYHGGGREPFNQNLLGAVVYLPLSDNGANKPFIGGVGTPEMNERFGNSTYLIEVRMDDGNLRYLSRRDGARFSIGDRVRTRDGRLEHVAD